MGSLSFIIVTRGWVGSSHYPFALAHHDEYAKGSWDASALLWSTCCAWGCLQSAAVSTEVAGCGLSSLEGRKVAVHFLCCVSP